MDFKKYCQWITLKKYDHELILSPSNEQDSPTFDRRVWQLVGAAAHESNVWVLSDKGRKGENKFKIIWF
jgi:hypothetical protein